MPGVVHPNAGACESIAARLSHLEDLRLPAALLREHPFPEPSAIQQHLLELLGRDAAVFLERYGLLLLPEELQSFEPLRDNYEVDFYIKQATTAQEQQGQDTAQQQQQQQQQQETGSKSTQHLSSTAKNRRLAAMRRLEQQGAYFSEQEMRERQPLVHWECIGRHEGHPAPAVPAATAGSRGFAGSLLASYDEAMLRARLQQELEDEEAAMSEQEDESSDDDAHAPQPQQQQQPQPPQLQQQQQEQQQQQGPEQQQQQRGGGGGGGAGSAAPPTSISTPAAASAARTAAARAGAATRAQAQQQQHGQEQQQQQQAHGADMSPSAMARRRHDFLQEMQHRFLEGLDGEQDYAAIDADSSLDEWWAKEQAQDAEDAYFGSD